MCFFFFCFPLCSLWFFVILKCAFSLNARCFSSELVFPCVLFLLQDIRKAVTMMKNIAVQLEKDNQTEKVSYY